MKGSFFFSLLLFGLTACGSNDKAGGTNRYSDDPVYKKGVALVGKNNCFNCHAINETITGPPYTEIGKRYKDATDSMVSVLAAKVISGGTGNWGPAIMIPHPGISKADAEAMVKYIILLGKNAQ